MGINITTFDLVEGLKNDKLDLNSRFDLAWKIVLAYDSFLFKNENYRELNEISYKDQLELARSFLPVANEKQKLEFDGLKFFNFQNHLINSVLSFWNTCTFISSFCKSDNQNDNSEQNKRKLLNQIINFCKKSPKSIINYGNKNTDILQKTLKESPEEISKEMSQILKKLGIKHQIINSSAYRPE